MRRNEKKAFYKGLIYLIGAIATIVIGKPWLQPDAASANPTLDNAIALQIDNLKQSDNKWIEIDLRDQQLFAWSGEEQTFSSVVSTGKAKTPTYPGIYAIQRKYPQDRMRGRDYDIPDVPHVLYFDRGYALHGAYWHNSFGTPISHGCINLPIDYAQQLFDWAEIGTTVIIHE